MKFCHRCNDVAETCYMYLKVLGQLSVITHARSLILSKFYSSIFFYFWLLLQLVLYLILRLFFHIRVYFMDLNYCLYFHRKEWPTRIPLQQYALHTYTVWLGPFKVFFLRLKLPYYWQNLNKNTLLKQTS